MGVSFRISDFIIRISFFGCNILFMKRALVIIAKQGFQDVELKGTRDGLSAAGFVVVLASTESGSCVGKFGSTEEASLSVRDSDVKDFDRVAFIGGPGAAALADDPACKALAQAVVASEKPLGAICIAPTILAKAGVLKGKKATVWDRGGAQAAILTESGATYVTDDVVTDGLIVTGNGPEAAEAFGKAFAALQA